MTTVRLQFVLEPGVDPTNRGEGGRELRENWYSTTGGVIHFVLTGGHTLPTYVVVPSPGVLSDQVGEWKVVHSIVWTTRSSTNLPS